MNQLFHWQKLEVKCEFFENILRVLYYSICFNGTLYIRSNSKKQKENMQIKLKKIRIKQKQVRWKPYVYISGYLLLVLFQL